MSRWAEPPAGPSTLQRGGVGARAERALRFGQGLSESARVYLSRRESCGSPSAAVAPKEVPIPEERAVVGRGWGLTEGCHGRGFRGNVGGGGGVEEGARAKYARAWRPGLQGDAGSEG